MAYKCATHAIAPKQQVPRPATMMPCHGLARPPQDAALHTRCCDRPVAVRCQMPSASHAACPAIADDGHYASFHEKYTEPSIGTTTSKSLCALSKLNLLPPHAPAQTNAAAGCQHNTRPEAGKTAGGLPLSIAQPHCKCCSRLSCRRHSLTPVHSSSSLLLISTLCPLQHHFSCPIVYQAQNARRRSLHH